MGSLILYPSNILVLVSATGVPPLVTNVTVNSILVHLPYKVISLITVVVKSNCSVYSSSTNQPSNIYPLNVGFLGFVTIEL